MSYIDNTRNIQKFGGGIWYVSKINGDDTDNNGKSPDSPFETIGKAITESTAGDGVVIMAGTYTETGIDVSKNSLELWFEIGAILDPASGTCLTVSGNYCRVICREGALRINNNSAAVTGVSITGNFCYMAEVRVACASVGNIGFDITGDGCDLRRCRCSDPLISAFKIQGDKTKLEDCCTGGTITNDSIGHWMTNSCDKFRLIRCGSQGHAAGAFQVDSGCTNGVIWEFSSGGGDGKWTDADNSTVISDLTYPETKYATQTFTGDGAGSTNLFKVIGSVEIIKIYGHVETVLSADTGNLNLEFDAGGTSVEITDTVAVGSAPVGSLFLKNDEATEALVYKSSANAGIIEAPTGFKAQQVISPFMLVAKDGTDSFITSDYSGTATSGVIHWHVEWRPLTDDGFLEMV